MVDAAFARTMLIAPKRGWKLAVTDGPDVGRTFELGWEDGIGREPDNAIRLADDKASRHHATITQRTEGFVLTDLGSSNGTFVDGERITEPRLLTPGVEIRIGTTTLAVRGPDAKGE
jgi:pSer/pThr/pTyr-binding forkhead associated (FHA) protein